MTNANGTANAMTRKWPLIEGTKGRLQRHGHPSKGIVTRAQLPFELTPTRDKLGAERYAAEDKDDWKTNADGRHRCRSGPALIIVVTVLVIVVPGQSIHALASDRAL